MNSESLKLRLRSEDFTCINKQNYDLIIDQAGTIETSVLARLVLDGNPAIGSRRPALCVRLVLFDSLH